MGSRAGRVRCTLTTHSGPCRAYGARFAVKACSSRAGGWVPGIALPVPTRLYPTPVVPSRHARAVASGACAGSARGACTYDRFWDRVGEPRGVEHSLNLGSRTGYIQLFEVWRLCTAV